MDELLSLKWNNHHTILLNMLNIIREKELYTDVTLVCNGKFYNVHKIVLSTCSLYFNEIFTKITCNNPVIILKEIQCQHLESLLDYMYIGEVKVKQTELNYLINTAEHLKIKGLAAADNENIPSNNSIDDSTNEDSAELFDAKLNIKRKSDASTSNKKRRKSKDKMDIDVETFMSSELSGVGEDSDVGADICDSPKSDIKREKSYYSEPQHNEGAEDPLKYSPGLLNSAENTTDEFYAQPGGSDEAVSLVRYEDLLSNSIDISSGAEYSASRAKTMDDEKKITCRVCGKRMKWPSQLVVHMRTHTGEKPFQCSNCDKTCTQKIHLKRHMLVKHNINMIEYE